MNVFISYHRSLAQWPALIIQRYLEARHTDVFLDTKSINSGRFESVILNEIRRREHFIVVLSKGSAERLADPGDWVARELKHAFEDGKNVIPVLVDGAALSNVPSSFPNRDRLLDQNALTMPDAYVDEALEKLYDRYLANPTIQERDAFLAEEHWERANKAFRQEDWLTAQSEIEKAINLVHRPEYFLLLSAVNDQQDRSHDALAAIDSAMSLDPFGVELMNTKFRLLQKIDKLKEAIDLYGGGWRRKAESLANSYAERILRLHGNGIGLAESVDNIGTLGAMHLDQIEGARQLAILQDICNFCSDDLADQLRGHIQASPLIEFRDKSTS